jgi:hypothetical protein
MQKCTNAKMQKCHNAESTIKKIEKNKKPKARTPNNNNLTYFDVLSITAIRHRKSSIFLQKELDD